MLFAASHILCHFGCGPLTSITWSCFYQLIPPQALAVNWKRLSRRVPCWCPSMKRQHAISKYTIYTPFCFLHESVKHVMTAMVFLLVLVNTCDHTNPNACMGLPWSLSVLHESKVLMGLHQWNCVCVCLIHTPCNIFESHSCSVCFILFSSLI